MNADTMVSANSRARPPCCHMQAVSFATKMLQTCSPISQCIQDGQLFKAQQLLERANSQWHPASQSPSEMSRCCSFHFDTSDTACISSLRHSPSTPFFYHGGFQATAVQALLFVVFFTNMSCSAKESSIFEGGTTPSGLNEASMQACSKCWTSSRWDVGVKLGSAAALHHCALGRPGHSHPAACHH